MTSLENIFLSFRTNVNAECYCHGNFNSLMCAIQQKYCFSVNIHSSLLSYLIGKPFHYGTDPSWWIHFGFFNDFELQWSQELFTHLRLAYFTFLWSEICKPTLDGVVWNKKLACWFGIARAKLCGNHQNNDWIKCNATFIVA